MPDDDTGPLLPELASLLLTTTDVQHALQVLTTASARTLPPEDSAGMTLSYDRAPLTVAGSDDRARALDEVQYGLDKGPCLQAMRTGRTVSVPDMAAEQRWDGYPAHALSWGVRSGLSLPLFVDGRSTGALNLYSSHTTTFTTPGARERATSLAALCGTVLAVVLRQAEQTQLTEQLQSALVSRSTIDQAIGIVMAQRRCDATEAFAVLRTASQHRNRKLHEIAADIVAATSRGQGPGQATPR